jgi:hypothetical protein
MNLKSETCLVIGNIIIRAHALNLHRTEHPADIINNLYISWRGLQGGLV